MYRSEPEKIEEIFMYDRSWALFCAKWCQFVLSVADLWCCFVLNGVAMVQRCDD